MTHIASRGAGVKRHDALCVKLLVRADGAGTCRPYCRMGATDGGETGARCAGFQQGRTRRTEQRVSRHVDAKPPRQSTGGEETAPRWGGFRETVTADSYTARARSKPAQPRHHRLRLLQGVKPGEIAQRRHGVPDRHHKPRYPVERRSDAMLRQASSWRRHRRIPWVRSGVDMDSGRHVTVWPCCGATMLLRCCVSSNVGDQQPTCSLWPSAKRLALHPQCPACRAPRSRQRHAAAGKRPL